MWFLFILHISPKSNPRLKMNVPPPTNRCPRQTAQKGVQFFYVDRSLFLIIFLLPKLFFLAINLLYKIYAEDCCAGVNVKKHEFLLDPNLKCHRLHSIYAIKGTLEPRDIHKKEEFIVQQDTIALRLAPTTQSEFNVDLQKEDNIIALFAKGSRGYLLADSISSTDNKHWYYVEMKDLPIPNTHYWYYEDNDSGNISYTGWIEK